MAPIDYRLLDTSIPAQLGALPGNAFAKYRALRAQDQALEAGQVQNALAKLQLGKAERDQGEDEAFRTALGGVKGGDYGAAMPDLMRASPSRAMALQASLDARRKAGSEADRSGTEAVLKRFEIIDRTAGQFSANPTRETGVWVIQQMAAIGTPPDVIRQMSEKLNATPDAELPKRAKEYLAATKAGIEAEIAKLNPRPGAASNLGRLIAERDALPPNDPRRAQYDQAIEIETTRKEPTPYIQFLPSGEGYLRGDTRTGRVTPVTVDDRPAQSPAAPPPQPGVPPPAATAPGAPPGRPPLPAAADPDLQARLAAARARGTAEGEAAGKAQSDLPRASAQSDELLRLTDELLAHPGLEQAVGTSSVLGVQRIPGTSARDFMVRLDQIKGKQFLEAFGALKGSGAITETEGKKATEAIARMDTSTSEPEFRRAVRDFQDVVRAGLERTKARAGEGGAQAPSAPQGSDNMPDPAAHVGRVIRDGQSGQRYRSDGRNWVRVE